MMGSFSHHGRLRTPRLTGRTKEAAGVYACECYADCRCTKRGLDLFRWALPRFHDLPSTDGEVALDAQGSS